MKKGSAIKQTPFLNSVDNCPNFVREVKGKKSTGYRRFMPNNQKRLFLNNKKRK